MKAYHSNIEKETLSNSYFRKVLFTGKYSQLVVMSLLPGEEIGNEIHNNVDQFFRVEQGKAKVIVNNGEEEFEVKEDEVFIIPAGTWHNVVNTGEKELKLYTIYSPPNHPDGTIHKNKQEAEEYEKAHHH
ncbi:MAG: cupin domain-containing protein [Patescibacteria group bacterium]|nr:cupin domain-containing protein [Patescibacteria group bacterium]